MKVSELIVELQKCDPDAIAATHDDYCYSEVDIVEPAAIAFSLTHVNEKLPDTEKPNAVVLW